MVQKRRRPVASRSLKETLLLRYRVSLVDKLTAADLRELQNLLDKEFDSEGKIIPEYRLQVEEKLRHYLPEEVMKKEMIHIETLLRSITPVDLITQS